MKKIAIALLLTTAPGAHAWDFSVKGDAQKAFTDNINLTNTNPIKDDFTILSGYLQAKNETWRLKLKGKMEKYTNQQENDNYITDLSLQYKRTKNNDYTLAVFKQVYNGVPLVSTDTTSDNSGLRLAANFTHDFVKSTTQGYFTVSGTTKSYSKITNRKDNILAAALGLEHYFAKSFMVAPELSFQHIGSADNYYSNNSYGPNILLSYIPDDTWELFVNGNYGHTTYTGRTVSKTVRNKKVTEKEYQELISTDAGVIYSFPQYVSLTAKYSNSHNSSNNSSSSYQANIFYVGLGVKF